MHSNGKDIIEELNQYQFIADLKNLSFVEKIYLFGSRAKRIHESRSDIDLAIVCPQASESDWNQVLEIVESADTLLSIDCIRYDQIENEQLKQSILDNHEVIFIRRTQT